MCVLKQYLKNTYSYCQFFTCDLSNESRSSNSVILALKLSDPDVELVCVMPAVILEELQALEISVLCHSSGL